MVRCERAALIVFIGYLQNRIYEACRESKNSLDCALEELERVKRKIEQRAILDVDVELCG